MSTIIADDLDGSTPAKPVYFSWGGTDYVIDLGEKNVDKMEKALKAYLDAATKVSARQAAVSTSKPKTGKGSRAVREYDKVAYRAWAESNGRWNGTRPANADIDAFLATLSS